MTDNSRLPAVPAYQVHELEAMQRAIGRLGLTVLDARAILTVHAHMISTVDARRLTELRAALEVAADAVSSLRATLDTMAIRAERVRS